MWYKYRLISPNETAWAKSVFDNSLPYNNIYFANGYLPGNHGVAVTVMSYSGGGNSIEPGLETPRVQDFSIYWGADIYNKGADAVGSSLDTLIHELTHVWQGYNEGALIFNYMIRSLASQTWGIISHLDRGYAYQYDWNNYLRWSQYNPEQQGNIVMDWFSGDSNNAKRGNRSTSDSRFVYIDKVIRPGKPNAPDTPATAAGQASAQLSSFSPSVQAYQRLLIRKGYRIKDDGFNGPQTDRAVRNFQRRHNLKADGFVGPKTLALLNKP